MAADIKNYLKEKEKRQKNQDDYKKKIRKHKLTIVYRVLLAAAALGAALAVWNANGYAYAVSVTKKITKEEMLQIVEEIVKK